MHIGTLALRAIGRQGWLPGRVRLIRALAPTGGRAFEADFFGLRFVGNTAALIDWSVYYLGAYEAQELQLLCDVASCLRGLRKTITAFDVGANIGNHTLRLSQVCDRVVAFEPHPGNNERLKRHVEMNGLTNVEVFDCALSDRTGEARIANFMGDNHGAAQVVGEGGERIVVERGDDLVQRYDLPRMDILKIDVEGEEPAVLRGFRETLLRDRPIVLFEVLNDNRNLYAGSMFDKLLYPDHALFSVTPRRLGVTRLYRVVPLDLDRSESVLCVPNELLQALPTIVQPARLARAA